MTTFEEAQRELEQIVERLERGDAGGEGLTRRRGRGEELYQIRVVKLDALEGRIGELAKSAAEPPA